MKLWTLSHNDHHHHDCNPLFKTVKHDFEVTWPLGLVVTSPPSQIWQLCWQGSDALYLLGPGLLIIIITITTSNIARLLLTSIVPYFHGPFALIRTSSQVTRIKNALRRTTARKRTARCLTGKLRWSWCHYKASQSCCTRSGKTLVVWCTLQLVGRVWVWPNKAPRQSLSPAANSPIGRRAQYGSRLFHWWAQRANKAKVSYPTHTYWGFGPEMQPV